MSAATRDAPQLQGAPVLAPGRPDEPRATDGFVTWAEAVPRCSG